MCGQTIVVEEISEGISGYSVTYVYYQDVNRDLLVEYSQRNIATYVHTHFCHYTVLHTGEYDNTSHTHPITHTVTTINTHHIVIIIILSSHTLAYQCALYTHTIHSVTYLHTVTPLQTYLRSKGGYSKFPKISLNLYVRTYVRIIRMYLYPG